MARGVKHPVDDGDIRGRILRAAEECFALHGVAKTTMQDIARAAKLARPTLYRHFASREDLVAVVLVTCARNFNTRAQTMIDRNASFEDAVVETLTLSVQVGMEDSSVRLILSTDAVSEARGAMAGETFQDVAAEMWLPLLRRGMETGAAAPDLDIWITARWLVDVEFLFATRILDGTMTIDAVPDMARRYVLPGLLPRQPTAASSTSGLAYKSNSV